MISTVIVRWLKSIFWSNGEEADKSAKFFLVTLLVLSFDFWGGGVPPPGVNIMSNIRL